MPNYPNFFIAGAPKCGTTAMDHFLGQHPEIFMAEKEMHYFGKDLPIRERISEAAYLSAFRGAGSEKVVGEASVWYLYSETAAREIAGQCPEARVLIMIRNPADMLLSLHNQHLLDGNEREQDPARAILKKGGRPYAPKDFLTLPTYEGAIRFTEGIRRFREALGPAQVYTVLQDDLRRDPDGTLEGVLRFLGVDPSFRPAWKGVNERRILKVPALHRLMKNPSAPLRKWAGLLLPVKSLRAGLMHRLHRWNVTQGPPGAVSQPLRRELIRMARPEVERLEALLGRNLQHWLQS